MITTIKLGEYKGKSKPTQRAIKQALDKNGSKLKLIEVYANITKDIYWIIILDGARIGQMLRNKTSCYYDKVDTFDYCLNIGEGL